MAGWRLLQGDPLGFHCVGMGDRNSFSPGHGPFSELGKSLFVLCFYFSVSLLC